MTLLDLLSKGVDTYFACKPQPKPSPEFISKARLIAHRGAYNHRNACLENTDAAFAKALKCGCWGIELDVHATSDQTIVVNHDPTLERLWKRKLTISTLTFKQLRQEAPLLPNLAEVVERYGRKMHLFIEIKAPFSQVDSLIDTLAPLTPVLDYHLLSLNESIFSLIENYFPKEALLLVPVHNNVSRFCKVSLEKHYAGVLAHYLLLKKTHLQALRAANQKVGVGFIDSKYCLYRELNRGIEWIFSNNVEQVSQYLQELQAEQTTSKG